MVWRGKAFEIACWVTGTAMVTLYFGERFVGEIPRQQGIETFVQARAPVTTAYPNFVTPDSFAWQEFQPLAAPSVPVSVSKERVDFPVDVGVASPESSPAPESMPIALFATETAAVTLVTCYPFNFVGHAPQRDSIRAVAQ